MVIPMAVGVAFTYSGFMVSHHQQNYKKNEQEAPILNLVGNNSERLFRNMMESFGRYLNKNELQKKKKFKY